jgi:hypothetical protein
MNMARTGCLAGQKRQAYMFTIPHYLLTVRIDQLPDKPAEKAPIHPDARPGVYFQDEPGHEIYKNRLPRVTRPGLIREGL